MNLRINVKNIGSGPVFWGLIVLEIRVCEKRRRNTYQKTAKQEQLRNNRRYFHLLRPNLTPSLVVLVAEDAFDVNVEVSAEIVDSKVFDILSQVNKVVVVVLVVVDLDLLGLGIDPLQGSVHQRIDRNGRRFDLDALIVVINFEALFDLARYSRNGLDPLVRPLD